MTGSAARTNLPQLITTTTYDAANQLTQWGTSNPTYDANGNMLSDGTNTYVWNARNQLASMNMGSASFQYDAFARRTAKTVLATTTNLLFDGVNPVQELSGTTPTANLLTGSIDEFFTRSDSSGTSNFLTDALGSTLALTDTSGNTLAQYTYEPFGNSTGSGSSTNSYQYTGRENDGTGLYFYRARYYNPALQRFISEDPAGLAGGINSYSYAGSSPANFSDPSGLDYNVRYDRNTNSLVVSATVGIYGPDANSQLANSWQQWTNSYWNAGNWKYGRCNVRFNFAFNFLPNFHPAWQIGPQNLVFVEHDTMPFDVLAVTYNNYGYWSQGILPWDAAHEMGHLLLLGDDYPKLMPQWLFNKLYGNHDGHIMSNNPRGVAQHEVDDVLAGRGCGCK